MSLDSTFLSFVAYFSIFQYVLIVPWFSLLKTTKESYFIILKFTEGVEIDEIQNIKSELSYTQSCSARSPCSRLFERSYMFATDCLPSNYFRVDLERTKPG